MSEARGPFVIEPEEFLNYLKKNNKWSMPEVPKRVLVCFSQSVTNQIRQKRKTENISL